MTIGVYVAPRIVGLGLGLGPVLGGAGIVGIALVFALRHPAVRTPDGARALLPNGTVLSSPLTNLTVNGHRRSERTVVDVVRPRDRPAGALGVPGQDVGDGGGSLTWENLRLAVACRRSLPARRFSCPTLMLV